MPRISFSAPIFASAVTNGIVDITNLVEASGVAASRNNPGVIWTENDSGNAAVVYAIDSQGRNLGTYALPGNTDNEDIGIGPGPVTNVSYLYVTDIGDNNENRTNIMIYQIPEPAVYFWQTNNPVSSRAMKGARTITLTYFTLSDSEPTGVQPLYYFARTSFDGPTPPRALVPMAAGWNFLANGSNQGTAWQSPGFDDSSWSNGAAQFGFGNSNAQTVVSYGANANNKYITTYFRKTFVATNVNRIANATLKLVVDDGANVFLNGTAIANVNLNSGAAYNTLATAMPTALRDTWQSYAVDPKLLVEDTNTITVEVHLASVTATNMAFDLQLVATEAPFITSIARLANQAKLYLVGSSNSPTTIQATTNFLSWTNLGSLLLTNGSGTFSDPAATNFNFRFYRAFRSVP